VASRDLSELETLLGYVFVRRELLVTALTHRSYANEIRAEDTEDNEKMEFLGDAVLDLVVGHALIEGLPDLHEGELSVARAQVVSEAGLSQAARELGLGDWLRLGRGEERSGGRTKPSLLADAFEAIVAAVYLDAGFDVAREFAARVLGPRIASVDVTGVYDFKTRLQEAAQAKLKATPEYRVINATGPDHDKTFEVGVVIGGKVWATASGKSKKEAEQRAAAIAAELIDIEPT
jgi:ribonuclease-3